MKVVVLLFVIIFSYVISVSFATFVLLRLLRRTRSIAVVLAFVVALEAMGWDAYLIRFRNEYYGLGLIGVFAGIISALWLSSYLITKIRKMDRKEILRS